MNTDKRSWQYQLGITIFHGPGFGHGIEMSRFTKGRNILYTPLGSWNGLGIPESVLTEARTTVDAALTQHLVTRYGVQGELPVKWAGEPDPF